MPKNPTIPPSPQDREERKCGPYLFVHIHKTAGISLRDSLDETHDVIYDYGIDGPKTSKIYLEKIYQQNDPYGLLCAIKNSETWLAGHFHLKKHSDFVDCRNIVSFLRNPLERLVSNYNHVRLYLSGTETIEQYIEHAKHQNLQYRYLEGGVPWECIGFIGITENIRESYEMINAELSLNLAVKHSNQNPLKELRAETLPADVVARIREINKKDFFLYEWALKNHQERYKFFSEGKQWCHGFYTINNKRVLHGVAFFASTDKPVVVNIFTNGVHTETLTANLFHFEQVKCAFPRSRYVAFKLEIATPENDYEVIVAETGQKLYLRATIPDMNR